MNRKGILVVIICLWATGSALAQVPEWAEGAVWYQILPERFRNAVTSNDPVQKNVVGDLKTDWQIHPWASDWYKRQVWEVGRTESFAELVQQRRYGGDLYGVYEKLEYLKALSVNVIALMPVFESPSVLKYDAVTFHHVDNNFGLDRKGDLEKIRSEKADPATWTWSKGDEALFELIKAAHDLDMKVVLQVVFHYCNRQFWAFRDVEENQQKSAYRDWFDIVRWDDPQTPDTSEFAYKTWRGHKEWPLFKKDENGLVPPVKEYILNATRRWMDPDSNGVATEGVDGWWVRFGDQWGTAVFKEWASVVRALNPDAAIVADLWQTPASWVEEAGLSLYVNDAIRPVLYDFFIREDGPSGVSSFHEKIAAGIEETGQARNAVLNPVDRIEACRLPALIKNMRENNVLFADTSHDHHYDPRRPSAEDYRLQKLMVMAQLTLPGSPLILYGDESGMWGCEKTDMLKPMLWKEFVYEMETYEPYALPDASPNELNADVLKTYFLLDRVRAKNIALRKGDFEALIVDDARGVYVYKRTFQNNEVVVFLNNSDTKQSVEFTPDWPPGTKVKNPLDKKKYHFKGQPLTLNLEQKSGALLVKSK